MRQSFAPACSDRPSLPSRRRRTTPFGIALPIGRRPGACHRFLRNPTRAAPSASMTGGSPRLVMAFHRVFQWARPLRIRLWRGHGRRGTGLDTARQARIVV